MNIPIAAPNITIRKSSDLRNSYTEISNYCRESNQPIILTKNGEGDLAVMSIELFNDLVSRRFLYAELEKTERNIKNGKVLTKEAWLERVNAGGEVK